MGLKREKLGWSQQQLAELRAYLYGIETNKSMDILPIITSCEPTYMGLKRGAEPS